MKIVQHQHHLSIWLVVRPLFQRVEERVEELPNVDCKSSERPVEKVGIERENPRDQKNSGEWQKRGYGKLGT
jgi:hypothetical protein